MMYSAPRAAVRNYHQLGSSKQQGFIPEWFWRLDVWNQSADRAVFLLKDPAKNLSLLRPPFWWPLAILVIFWLIVPISASLVTLPFSLCLWVFPNLSLFKIRTSVVTFRLHSNLIWPHLNYFCKDLSKYSPIDRGFDLNLSFGDIIQPTPGIYQSEVIRWQSPHLKR